jgi:hydroxypyruvate reductase/glycerate 2-kinase
MAQRASEGPLLARRAGGEIMLRDDALLIWHSAVDAARPQAAVRAVLTDPQRPLAAALRAARRILVGGTGKAGLAMSQAVEQTLGKELLAKVEGIVNVPDCEGPSPLERIEAHGSRPAGSNQPTERGVTGAERILQLFAGAGPEDIGLCLLSGGGSALLPAPAEGLTLADKQEVTRLLHACGATINEMNAVRKHLSRIKGGRLAEAFHGRALYSLVISDVIGDPLDVIASGPTAPDPTTFADALAVLEKFQLIGRVPQAVVSHLHRGMRGEIPETPKQLEKVQHLLMANNVLSLAAAARTAEKLGYRVLNLGSYIEGETQPVALALAGVARSILKEGVPLSPPVCLLSGGETTVTLPEQHGLGGRNQEFVLAAGLYLEALGEDRWLVLSGGTDGEDGPTDAAGALAVAETFRRAAARGLDGRSFLRRHDAYHFFEATGDLMRTGLTQTNVMDVRVLLVGGCSDQPLLFRGRTRRPNKLQLGNVEVRVRVKRRFLLPGRILSLEILL